MTLQSSITSAGKSLFLCFSTLDVRSAKSLQTKALKSFTRVNIENRMITQPLLWHTFNLLLMVNKLGNQTWDTLRNCQGYITIVSCMFISYLNFCWTLGSSSLQWLYKIFPLQQKENLQQTCAKKKNIHIVCIPESECFQHCHHPLARLALPL